ncbi:hypothetical protein EMIHUDRAFT_62050, partial [Emiliania huxleyi CCMP1516]|uniref:3-deoxy-8-phosphooctulonate synthase n=2 Tax=Emiliania huxleyi TaxID=2903 RepID=A0A0D3IE95_EMIH1
MLRRRRFVMAGPNVIESEAHAFATAAALAEAMAPFDATLIFKASFDKANRTSGGSYRGVGLAAGCRLFERVRSELGLPVVTDVHEPHHPAEIAHCVDVIQIPAFLCRQTDLIAAAGATGRVVQIKKGQFASAEAMHQQKRKALDAGAGGVILCERGSFFGYHDTVVDPRNLRWLREEAAPPGAAGETLVCLDVTHSLQRPSKQLADGRIVSGGSPRDLAPWMARLGLAFGAHGLFVEVHEQPDAALCDAPTQWPLHRLSELLD